ncbi:MAG: sigma-54 dependent transcriptional regulator [Sorangiineae bacterium]|nr:sigma-54 dependent transcriptional regulator [Polyangiaceae bacterium]MEB2321448.1 sigma-54 dependent transcriptional regulator [Sorangiineae bacterium]
MPRGQLLLVDDEPSILSTLKKALSLEGYAVDVAGGVGIALERLAKRSYDVMLLDVALPDGDGVELLERLRKSGNDAPVIMMSGHATVDAAVRATKLGALDFLEKPLSTDRLLIVLENTFRLMRAEEEARELRAEAGYFDELLGESRAMAELRDQVGRAAKAAASVLLTGERGTGKELVARAVHRASPRAKGPLEKLNCAAVPAELIESELFGHEAGAFTGATKQRRGKFERASGGTLFLDEVGDMPLAMQAKLLRVLQEREIERVGGSETFKVDVRVVAATNKDLVAACAAGDFRPDLHDRLNVLPLELPPLRARREDIPLLARHFLEQSARDNGRSGVRLTDDALAALGRHAFPGNVRELKNLVERLVILSPDDSISTADVERSLGMGVAATACGLYRPGVPYRVLVDEAERTILEEALAHHGGQMASTARALGLERSHLYKKTRALGLRGGAADEEEAAR